ncbi:MAG: hypothetical protein ACQEQO_09625, partial [Thermodesulfobacteriota bacterium]
MFNSLKVISDEVGTSAETQCKVKNLPELNILSIIDSQFLACKVKYASCRESKHNKHSKLKQCHKPIYTMRPLKNPAIFTIPKKTMDFFELTGGFRL